MRHTGSKNKIARREATDLGMKTPGSKSHASLLRRINVLPGQHGTSRRRKVSERGRQLREKQKLRYMFGITERQLKNYFTQASAKEGNTAHLLSQSLERRLDNVVYRLGFAPTRAAARQLVSHGHISVGGKRLSISSYQVKAGDVVTFSKAASSKIPYVESLLANKDLIIPEWFKKEAIQGSLISEPDEREIEKQVDLRSVIEYYSR